MGTSCFGWGLLSYPALQRILMSLRVLHRRCRWREEPQHGPHQQGQGANAYTGTPLLGRQRLGVKDVPTILHNEYLQ